MADRNRVNKILEGKKTGQNSGMEKVFRLMESDAAGFREQYSKFREQLVSGMNTWLDEIADMGVDVLQGDDVPQAGKEGFTIKFKPIKTNWNANTVLKMLVFYQEGDDSIDIEMRAFPPEPRLQKMSHFKPRSLQYVSKSVRDNKGDAHMLYSDFFADGAYDEFNAMASAMYNDLFEIVEDSLY